jgi:hypothetical protein
VLLRMSSFQAKRAANLVFIRFATSMSSHFVGPLTRFLFVNELDHDVFVNVISRFDFGEEEYDLCLKAHKVTECNFTVESHLDHHSLYICPQRNGSTPHPIMPRYDHECPDEAVRYVPGVRLNRIRCLAVPDVAFFVLTEGSCNYSPASLSQLSLWACVLHGFSSNDILEFMNRFYETERIQYHRVLGADLEEVYYNLYH